MQITKILIKQINPAPYNPRRDLKPGDPEYEKIRRSIEEPFLAGYQGQQPIHQLPVGLEQ